MHRAWTIAVVLAALPAGEALAQQADEWDDRAVAEAIDKAKGFIWSHWDEQQGHWPEKGQVGSRKDSVWDPNHGGQTALCLYALLAAGESPQDPRVKRSFEWLAKIPIHGVYARSVRANALAMLGRTSKYRGVLTNDVRWLVRSMYHKQRRRPDGTYPYLGASPGHPNPGAEDRGNWDNSNSQMAVLGVWAGVREGVEVPRQYWQIVEKHWIGCQQGDGGWDYSSGKRRKTPGRGYGAMTAAGVATLFICQDNLRRQKDMTKCVPVTDPPAIVKGMGWLENNFTPVGDPGLKNSGLKAYYLYGVERVGLASGRKYFGKKDWYKQGTRAILGQLDERGGINDVVETSFALLFLARGRRPVLFNKLQYNGTWNSRPRDMANLARWISREIESEVNWQIIHLGAPVAEWHDAPIVYISGASAPQLDEKDLAKLKQFVEQGGMILSETACGKTTFDSAMRKLYAKMFPQYELKRLGRGHPIYNLHFKRTGSGLLYGISNGVRLLAVHSPADLSRAWQLNAYLTQPVYFRLAANLYFYVTDKGSPRSRGVSHWPTPKTFKPERTVRVALVKHNGHWNPEPLAWRRFAILMGNRHRVKVELSEPTAPADLDASAWPVAAMTATAPVTFTAPQLEGLRKYVLAGGTLLVDAAGGDKGTAASLAEQLAKLLPDAALEPIASAHPLYARKGMEIRQVKLRRALMASRVGPARPRLQAASHKGRLAIIFSPEDLTAGLVGYSRWQLRGYAPPSAFQLVRNVVLYASDPPPGR